MNQTAPQVNPAVSSFASGAPGSFISTQALNAQPGQTAFGSNPATTIGGGTSGVDTTIPATAVGNTTPFTAPAPQSDSGAQNSLGSAVAPLIQNNEDSRNAATSDEAALESIMNPGADELNQENAAGIPGLQSQVDALNTQAVTTGKHYDDLINKLYEGGASGVIDKAGVQTQVDALTRQKNSDLANIAIQQSSATGDLTRMQDIITKKVTADTDAQQSKINALKDYISNIDADPEEKAQMTAQANSQQATLDENKTTYENVVKNAANNNAPSSVLASISKAAQDPNATAATITAAAGQYGSDPTVKSTLALQASETAKNNADTAVEAGSLSPQQATAVNAVNSQLDSNPTTKAFQVTASEYANIQNIPENTTDPVQDLSLMTSMAHLLSPGSNSLRGVLQLFKPDDLQSGAWNTLNGIVKEFDAKGELSPASVNSLKTLAGTMYDTQASVYKDTRQSFVNTLQSRGVKDADSLVTNYAGIGNSQTTAKEGDSKVYEGATYKVVNGVWKKQ